VTLAVAKAFVSLHCHNMGNQQYHTYVTRGNERVNAFYNPLLKKAC